MSPQVSYKTAPTLTINLPTCNGCAEEVEADADGLECPRCGTTWDHDAGEDTPGELYQDWAGEPNEGEPRTHDDGWKPTQHERENPKPGPWADFGAELGKIMAGGAK